MNRSLFLFVSSAVLAVCWRFYAIPSDFGGLFAQGWILAVGLSVLAREQVETSPTANYLLMPVFSWMVWMPNFLAGGMSIVLIFPLMAMAGGEMKQNKVLLGFGTAGFVGLLAVIFMATSGLRRLRFAEGSDIARLDFVKLVDDRPDKDADKEVSDPIEVTSPGVLDEFASAAHNVFPYNPNHEGIHKAWEVTVTWKDGATTVFKVGEGNRATHDTAWVELKGTYQSKSLYSVLAGPGIGLWQPLPKKDSRVKPAATPSSAQASPDAARSSE